MKKFISTLSFILLSLFIFAAVFSVTACKEQKNYRSSYQITLIFDGEKIDGQLIYKTIPAASDMDFCLYANAYRDGAKHPVNSKEDIQKAYPDGISYGEIRINSATINEKSADYELIGEDLNNLRVNLGEVKNEEIAIGLSFTTIIPDSINRLGKNGEKVNLCDFFPIACVYDGEKYYECVYSNIGDPYYSEACDYTVSLTLPSVYTVASSGMATGSTIGGENTTYTFNIQGGRDFAFALGKDFQVTQRETGDVKIYYYSDEVNENAASLAASCIEYFSEIFGEYPYKTYSLAEVGFIESGMEHSGMCFISNTLPNEEKMLTIIHETAHEWWYSAVGNNQIEEAFLDEGLAEYSTYLYLLNNGYENLANEMIKNAKSAYKSFFSINELLSGSLSTNMNKTIFEFKNKYDYINIAYNKSLIMFSEYEKAVGQNRAIKGLSAFYKNNLYKNVCADDLIDYLGLKEFFYSYIDGKVLI